MSRTIHVKVELPDGKSVDHEFTQDSVIIGSGPSAALKIESSDVSSMHAILKVADDGVTLSDLGSEAGTTINGKSITDEVSVAQGDEIKLGGVKVTFEVDAAKGTEVAKDKDKSEVAKDEEKAEEKAADTESKAKSADEPKAEAEAKADAEDDGAEEPKAKSKAKAKAAVSLSDEDLDEAFLSDPLIEENKPDDKRHCLEIIAHWGDTVVDAVQLYSPGPVNVTHKDVGKGPGDLSVTVPLSGFAGNFTLAQNQGTQASIVVPSEAKVGLRTKDGKIERNVSMSATDAPFPAQAYQLSFGERLAFKVGSVTFTAQYTRGDAAMGRGAPIDWYFPRIFIISALVHAFFVVAAFLTPKFSTNLTDDLFKNENRFAQMILKAPEKEKKRKKLDLSGSKGGAKHKGEEGKFGKKDKPKKDALASKAGAPRVDPNKREKDRKIAMNSGLLGILKGAGGSGAVSNVFGPGGLGTGINNAMGGLRGSAMGDAGGAGGLGTRGAGAGGGGNSLGIGGLGTHGHGRGTGGYGNIDLGGRGKGTTRIVPGRTIIKGSLSKQEISRVIRRNLARFKYCYEKQLNANPNLSGKISVYFTIAPTGSVAKATVRETSMNDSKVEKCVTKVMKSLKFPQPKGGGIVVVTYPFVFAAS